MKIIKVLLVFLLIGVAAYATLTSNKFASKARKDLQEERFLRIVAEEGLDKASAEIESLENAVKRSSNKIVALKKQLEQKKIANKDLRSRLDRAKVIKGNIDRKVAELESMLGGGRKSIQTP